MMYSTNHSWCSESNWNNENFGCKVVVSFQEFVDTDSISEYNNRIEDPDFSNLVEKKKFFDEKETFRRMEIHKDGALRRGEEFNEEEFLADERDISTKQTPALKQEVIDWLNANVKDREHISKGSKSPLADKKGWATGNDEYNSRASYIIHVFFARQVDALKFIRKFSIFKTPTFYFDYFHDDRREMAPAKIIEVINKTQKYKINPNNQRFENRMDKETSTNLDYSTFKLLDWEKKYKTGNEDDVDMTKDEIKTAIKEITSVDTNTDCETSMELN